jgi:transcriptional regulator with XRE-family HTH domain
VTAYTEFGVRLDTLRREKGIDLAALAEGAEINRTTLYKWMACRLPAQIRALIAIADALDVSTDRLLGATVDVIQIEEPPPSPESEPAAPVPTEQPAAARVHPSIAQYADAITLAQTRRATT